MQDVKNAIDHLKNHQKYPATKEQLVKECDDLSDFTEEDKKWNRRVSFKIKVSEEDLRKVFVQ